MEDLGYRILHTVSSAANLGEASSRLLDLCLEHTSAKSGACLRAAPASNLFLVISTRGGVMRSPHWNSAMIRMKNEHSAITEISEDSEGLLFDGTRCFANLSTQEGFLIRLEWNDVLQVEWDRMLEMRKGCRDLGDVLRRYEQLDSRMTQLQKMQPMAPASSLDKDLDQYKLEKLLPIIVRLVVTRTSASSACVLAAPEPGALTLEANALVGEPSLEPDKFPIRVDLDREYKKDEPIYIRSVRKREAILAESLAQSKMTHPLLNNIRSAASVPVEIAGEIIAVLTASSCTNGAVDGKVLNGLMEIAQQIRPYLWKALLYKRTSGQNIKSPLLMVGLPHEVLESAERFSAAQAPILLHGETGTGKEALARFIHLTSNKCRGPFITVNAAEITESLAESQLFGHQRGSFTGAHKDASGAFEMADKGTLFLDEIDHLNVNVQAKVLRAIEYGEIRPLGARDSRQVDVRIIAATNKDLPQEVQEGRFLQDLLLRIHVFEIKIPPLRHNRDAIPRIARAVADHISAQNNKVIQGFTPRSLKLLQKYDFPGNIRELRNILQNALVTTRGSQVDVEAFPERLLPRGPSLTTAVTDEYSYDQARAQFEKDYLIRLVRQAKGNMTVAATLAGLDRSHLYRMLKKHGLSSSDIVEK